MACGQPDVTARRTPIGGVQAAEDRHGHDVAPAALQPQPGLIGGETPGQALHDGWLYKSAAVPVLTLALAPGALGTAQAALEAFKKRLPGREIAYTQHEVQIDSPVTHIQAATAATKIDTAQLLLHHCADEIQAAAERGEAMDFAKRARVRMDCAYAVRLCLEAVETIYLASGGSGIADTSTIEIRFSRSTSTPL